MYVILHAKYLCDGKDNCNIFINYINIKMKKLFTLLTLLTLIGGGNLWAETGTEKATNTGTKDTDITGKSYTIAGTYIAGSGGAQATGMANKGVKFRTGNDGKRLVFTVNTGYTITDFKLYGVSNYALASGKSEPCIAVTKILVDDTETTFDGTGNFPAKGASTAGSVLLSDISATETIAIYFDNSNADGTQINGYYEITWSTVDAAQPLLTTVSPTSAYVAVGSTKQLTGSFTGGTFTGEWLSDNESVATVSDAGVVTGVSEGTANITYQWTEDQSEDAYKATATITVVEAFNANNLTAVKTYDFANWGSTTLTISSTSEGKIWNAAQTNVTNNAVYRCTNTGLESLAIQAVYDKDKKGWTIDDSGLLEGSGAGRCAAICDVKAGQYIEFVHDSGTSFYTRNESEDDGAKKIPLVEENNHHVYKVLEDGMVGFEMTKGKHVTKVVIYEKKSGEPTSLSFSAETATATLGEAFTAPTLTKDPADLAGVVFSSSNTAVATVDAESGELTLVAGGITTIIATFEETDEYWGATASYELTVVDPNVAGYENEGVTITWPFSTGATGQTATIVYNSAEEELFKNNNVSIGANLEYAGTQALNGDNSGVTSTKIKQNNAGSETEQKNAIKFSVTPKTGMTFTPTKVSFLATRCGTDGGKMVISWIDSENTTVALGSAAASKTSDDPARDNNTTNNATKYSYDLTSKGAKATTGECGLQIITYSANGKSYAFGQIIIEGTLSGQVSAVTTYTITAQVNIDGAGSVNPSEAVVDEGEGTKLEATDNTGYVFQNWSKSSDASWTSTENPLTISEVTADETYTANYKRLFSVNYDATGEGVMKGTCNTVLGTEYASVDDKFTAPKNLYLTKEGCTFHNWTDGTNTYEAGQEYTLISDIVLAPVFATSTQSLDNNWSGATVTWNFKNTEVFFNSQGNTQYFVQQAEVNGEKIDVAMFCDTQNGKLNNVGRNDQWAQANGGTVLTIPAIKGMTIVATGYQQFSNTTFAGSTEYEATTADPWKATYTYNGNDATLDIVIGSDISYLSSVIVTYPQTVTSITKTISAAGYATLCSEYPLDFTGSGVAAYIATMDGTTVKFTEVASVPAQTGVLLKGEAGDKTINVAASTTDVSTNVLVGVTAATEVAGGIYVLMNTTEYGVGFYKTNAEKFTVGANTAYLPADVAEGRSFIGFDEATAIEEVATAIAENGEVYDLQGRRVAKPAKGLYIVDGKKMLMK